MTSDLSERVAQLLRTRREQLLQVKAENAWWLGIDRNLTEIPAALDELRRHPSVSPDDALDLVVSHLQEIRADISGVIETYNAVEARFSRETVNIGVSGSARVGKSTLLQSISGLTDEQIPTGRDIPVTAVRSRIYRSPRLRVALLRLHSPETFLNEAIRPYHAALSRVARPVGGPGRGGRLRGGTPRGAPQAVYGGPRYLEHGEFGPVDAMKPRSCLTLFARAAPGESVFGQVLAKYFGGISDPVTEQRL